MFLKGTVSKYIFMISGFIFGCVGPIRSINGRELLKYLISEN